MGDGEPDLANANVSLSAPEMSKNSMCSNYVCDFLKAKTHACKTLEKGWGTCRALYQQLHVYEKLQQKIQAKTCAVLSINAMYVIFFVRKIRKRQRHSVLQPRQEEEQDSSNHHLVALQCNSTYQPPHYVMLHYIMLCYTNHSKSDYITLHDWYYRVEITYITLANPAFQNTVNTTCAAHTVHQ